MESIQKAIQDFIAKINAWLATLPPLEQVDAASQIGWAIRQIREIGEQIGTKMSEIDSQLAEFKKQVNEEAQAKAKENLIAAGEVMLKADAELAANAAREDGAREAREAMQAEQAEQKKIVERRAQVVVDGLLSAEAAERLTDEIFKPDNFMDAVTKVSGRMAKIGELKLSTGGASAAMAEMAGIPLDEAGDATFEQRLGLIKEIAGAGVGANAERQQEKPPGGKPPLDLPNTEPDKKARYAF